jgi:hypothetical protein
MHLAMRSLHSSAAVAPSGLHIWANIPPHVIKHPKKLVSQSSITLITEVMCTTWQYIHLMLLNIRNTHPQSSNMRSQKAFTTGYTINLAFKGASENIP